MKILEKLIDFILPPRCIVTGEIVDRQGMIAPEIWGQLNFISDPQCVRCGYPFDFEQKGVGINNLCASCLRQPPIYGKLRSSLFYDNTSRDIILAFKHGDRTHAAPSFMPWLYQAGRELIDQVDFIVPVPLHRYRLLKRRYNQAAILAQYFSKETNIPCLLRALKRQKYTQTQGYLRESARKRNVKNAFSISSKEADKLKGTRILLIDDVYTTGATVTECANTLLNVGVSNVDVLTIARVVKPQK